MRGIGIIDPERLRLIPPEHHAAHEFCFHLHDQMAGLLVEMEATRACEVSFPANNETDLLEIEQCDNIIDLLNSTGREHISDRIVLNQINMALFSDCLHFMYEALIALEKRKFSVSLSLLRKPFKEGLLLACWMCGREAEFLQYLKDNPARTLDQTELSREKKIEIFEAAKERCKGSDFIDASQLYDLLYNRKNEYGFARLFDLATHLVTRNQQIATERMNINLIFKNPLDNDIYENFYSDIAKIILFMNLVQIELYGRMAKPKDNYKNWLIFTSIGAFEAIFTEGRPDVVKSVNKAMKSFLVCPGCNAPIRVRKSSAARFFIRETLACRQCGTEHHFPLGWLLSRLKWNFG